LNDMNEIWQRIMPNGPQLGNYFEFEFVPLPNKSVEGQEPIFKERVEQLRNRFEAGIEDSLFIRET